MVTLNLKLDISEKMVNQLKENGLWDDRARLEQTLVEQLEQLLAWERIEATFAALAEDDEPISMEEITAVVKQVRAGMRQEREGRP